MATTHYYLHQERIAHSVANFFHDRSDIKYTLKESKKEYEVYVCSSDADNIEKTKEKSILKIFFSSSKTSFQIQGKETFREVCNQCRDKIIEECRIQNIQTANRHFTYNKVSSKSFNEILEWFRQTQSITVKNHPGDHVIVSRHTICGAFDSYVSLTYYHNETLLIQGLISSLLIMIVQEVNVF